MDTPRAWALALLALCAFSLALGAVSFIAGGDVHSAAAYAARFLLARAGEDSWAPMIQAVEHLRSDPQTPLYAKLFFADRLKFQYPISSLVVPDLWQRASGASWPAVVQALNWFSWMAVWLTAVTSALLFVGRFAGFTHGTNARAHWTLVGSIILAALMFYPLTRSYVLGQIQTLITLLVALALLAWCKRAKAFAGVCIGVCCTIKPQWGIIFLWAALRREWEFTIAGAATAAAVFVAAGLLYGFTHYLDYLPVLAYLSQHGESYFANQSVNGVMNRLLGTGSNLEWAHDAFPAYDPLVHAATTLSGLLIIGVALLFRRREKPDAIDLALIILSVTIASPIAWEHHYAALFPIFALVAPIAMMKKPWGRATGLWLLGAFVLSSQRMDLANRLWDTPLNVLQAYLFFGALIVLVLLYRLAGAAASDAGGTKAASMTAMRRAA